jgi:hypothetical protein
MFKGAARDDGQLFLCQSKTKGVNMLRNVSQCSTPKTKIPIKRGQHQPNWQLIFNKKPLIYIPNPGGQLRPKYPYVDNFPELLVTADCVCKWDCGLFSCSYTQV